MADEVVIGALVTRGSTTNTVTREVVKRGTLCDTGHPHTVTRVWEGRRVKGGSRKKGRWPSYSEKAVTKRSP